MGFGGAALRLTSTFLYGLEFCCAGIILGVYSYFLAVLADHDAPIKQQWKAVEGLSGCAVLYTIFAVVLTCFLGGIRFFAFLGIVFDVLFCGAFIAIAILTDDGADSCNRNPVVTPIGIGDPNANSFGFGNNFGFSSGDFQTYVPRLGLACRLNKAAFAVSIIGAFLFLISAFLQLWVSRHHQKEKKYGPSPANNYTSGSGTRGLFSRKPRGPKTTKEAYVDPESNGIGNSTADNGATGYHSGPVGTAVSSQSYDPTR